MCGFTGFLDFDSACSRTDLITTVRRMTSSIMHRGPDDSGEWVDEGAGTALGFRRLSILDLSPAGHQPMMSSSGRYVIVFNGEVYNFERVRAELVRDNAAPLFRGHSDTEVLLAAFEAWGIHRAVQRFIGMFAFAVWDRQEQTLTLGRDRVGVKPLYYGTVGRTFVFGSELKALRQHPDFDLDIDRDALTLFLRHSCIPAPYSAYRGIRKLAPGTTLTIRRGQVGEAAPYWCAREVAERRGSTVFRGAEADAEEELDVLLRDSVGLRMIADVPLGVFLSGGIDSSVVAAMMQSLSSRPVKTFTIGFNEEAFNEAEHAKAIAQYLGTEHTETYVTPQQARDVIPLLPAIYDEPFADPSQVPTYLVSHLARQHVTVSLSGDGGDELFGGYNRYLLASNMWRGAERMPRFMRNVAGVGMRAVPPGGWDAVLSVFPRKLRRGVTGDRIHKFAGIVNSRTIDDVYRRLVSHWDSPETLVRHAHEPPTMLTGHHSALTNPIDKMMYLDLVTYLPDDILVKVDRASMAVSLEAREPLLDHRLIEFAWSLPQNMKIRAGKGKWLLRKVLERYVPSTLIDRPKMGFGVPIDRWLRGPLRDWAEDLLGERRLASEGLLNPAPIRNAWRQHLSGRRNLQYQLWDVLMLQAWLVHQRNTD